MLRRLINTGRAALLVMPWCALCEQKANTLELLLKHAAEAAGKGEAVRTVKRMYGGQGGLSIEPNTGGCTRMGVTKA